MYKFFINKKFQPNYKFKKKLPYEISHHSKNILYKTSFGKKNKHKTFFVIKRSPGGGFFSNLIFVIKWINFAQKKNFIPIVDMENFPTNYNENKNIDNIKNIWEIYFKQISKYKLSEVYKSKNVIFCKNKLKVSLQDYNNQNLVKTYNDKIKIKEKIILETNTFYKNKLKTKKNTEIVGIHFRGTDQKITPGHYLPPTIFDIKMFIEKKIKENPKLKIFLITEEKKYLETLKKKYHKYLYFYPSFRGNKISDFNSSNRLYHRNKLGLESLKEALILSKCDEIFYCKSNIPLFSIFISKKKITKTLINNGLNSYNPFFAYFKWRVLILPISFLKYLLYKIF